MEIPRNFSENLTTPFTFKEKQKNNEEVLLKQIKFLPPQKPREKSFKFGGIKMVDTELLIDSIVPRKSPNSTGEILLSVNLINCTT